RQGSVCCAFPAQMSQRSPTGTGLVLRHGMTGAIDGETLSTTFCRQRARAFRYGVALLILDRSAVRGSAHRRLGHTPHRAPLIIVEKDRNSQAPEAYRRFPMWQPCRAFVRERDTRFYYPQL